MKWRTTPLDAIKAITPYAFVGGPFGSNLTSRDYVDEGVPVIRGNNLAAEAAFHDNDFVFVSESKAEQLHSNTAYPGDLVFTQRGTLGQVGLIPTEPRFQRYIISQSQMKLTVAPNIADSRFVYYFFRQPKTIQKIINHATSSGVPHINLGTLKSFAIRLPDVQYQRQIAKILSGYDYLIENNRRRMALLEDAARQLYKEWFVRLRFPGYEHTSIIDDLPEGWREEPLGRVTTKLGSGFTPRGGESIYLSEGVPLIRSMNVYDDAFLENGLAFVGEDHADALSGVTVESRDILLNITGASVARCCMAPERFLPARVNQHVMIIRVDPAKADPFFVHKAINSDERKRQLLSYAQKGSTREALTKEMVARFAITLPTNALMRQFGDFAAELFQQRENLALQNQKLRTARDLLLPRLMSGELAV
ncbi:restriction endonuclease subunit S [uncultured Thiodictyon sp.]|uniref:restriction endonuclease subunit S n=1 Tax=uncultured Thiodictyon sp. TaxID=1846217 RepID=UPI0025F59E24|nr:restriction endonuclease subunit S [uncultured Thiodictyon sp.]